MSKFMQITGIVFAAIGIALGFMVFFSPGQMQVVAVTPDVAVLLMVGGVLAIGIGGVLAILEGLTPAAVRETAASPSTGISPTEDTVIPEFNRRLSKFMPPHAPHEEISPSVRDTITALENAKSDIDRALGEEPEVAIAPPASAVAADADAEIEVAASTPADELPEEDADAAEPQTEDGEALYVVEEKLIRGRSARVLSDGTVEAETDEGWMRFENLEHLDEYLEVMAPAAKA